jgi:chromosome segregation ATPase
MFDEPTSTTTSLSTDTRLSSTSSNRTLDENCRSRKSSLTSDNTFEKYRFAMQKEIEALQSKGRKMEATIQSLEDSKNAVKTQLLEKDQELADMRAKNNALQKTVSYLLLFIVVKKKYIISLLTFHSLGDPTRKIL